MEKFFYETRPYFFLVGGAIAVALGSDRLMKGSGLILIATSVFIIYHRSKHRNR